MAATRRFCALSACLQCFVVFAIAIMKSSCHICCLIFCQMQSATKWKKRLHAHFHIFPLKVAAALRWRCRRLQAAMHACGRQVQHASKCVCVRVHARMFVGVYNNMRDGNATPLTLSKSFLCASYLFYFIVMLLAS